jgi:hypothetical protein
VAAPPLTIRRLRRLPARLLAAPRGRVSDALARRDEIGSISAPIIWPLAICLFVIPVLIMVLSFPTWIERQNDATDAARTAARALVTANSWAQGVADANAAVADIATNNGLDPNQITTNYTGSLQRGGVVTASVTVVIPTTVIPGLATVGQRHWTATATARVDDYRSLG